VAIGDIDQEAAAGAAASLGPDVLSGKLDVTDPESCAAFLALAERELGPLDVLINNAGIMPVGRIIDEPDAVTRRILDINVYGVILGSKLAAQRMAPRGTGHVINIASLAGETYAPGLATYCASKFAVIGFTDAARTEYRKAGVKFSMVLPAFVNTELISGTAGAKGFKNAEPADIADAIVNLLAKPKSRVRVPKSAGAVVVAFKFVPRPLAEALNRILGGDHVFTDDVDVAKRSAYEARARGEE
jgi:NAD(P)-dependent dehydrogenase (short-subunit alcohol dehydrogenase family)